MIFDKNILRNHNDDMLFYAYPIKPEFKNWKVKMGLFDGRYTGAPKGYPQSVELHLVLQTRIMRSRLRSLKPYLRIVRPLNIYNFLNLSRMFTVLEINNLMTDFEFAISKAASMVFTNINIRDYGIIFSIIS